MRWLGKEYLTADDISKRYGIAKDTAYQWVRRGTIESYRYFNFPPRDMIKESECTDPRESGKCYIRAFLKEDVEKKIRGMRGRRIEQWQK